MENHMREYFATHSEVEQTMPLDMLGKSGYRDRDWRYRMLMDGAVHREAPTFQHRTRRDPAPANNRCGAAS